MKAKGRLFWAALFILCAAAAGYLIYGMFPKQAPQTQTPTRQLPLPPQGKPDYRRLLPRKARTADMVFIGKTVCPLRNTVTLPAGVTISALNVHAGQAVRQGDVLATYSPDPHPGLRSASSVRDLGPLLTDLVRQLDDIKDRIRTLKQNREAQATRSKKIGDIENQAKMLDEQVRRLLKRMDNEDPGKEKKSTAKDPYPAVSGEAESMPEGTKITSPMDGHVLWVHPEIRAGARWTGADPAFVVGVMDPMLVRSHVYEEEALRLALGDRVTLQPESLHPRKFEASISRISWTPLSLDPLQPSYYEVEFTAPNPELELREGMRAIILLHKPFKPSQPVNREKKQVAVPENS